MRSLAMVSSEGRVFWPPIVRFRSSCKVDITYFPFDDQVCHMKLGSWAYDGFQVIITIRNLWHCCQINGTMIALLGLVPPKDLL